MMEAVDGEFTSDVTVHRPQCVCSTCERGLSVPVDRLSDVQLAACVVAAPTDRSPRTGAVHPYRMQGCTMTFDGMWGEGVSRTVTLRWVHFPNATRTLTVPDVRLVGEASYVDGGRRRVHAGLFELVEVPLSPYPSRDHAVPVADIVAAAEGLVDPVVEMEAESETDYGYGGEMVETPAGTLTLFGWRRTI